MALTRVSHLLGRGQNAVMAYTGNVTVGGDADVHELTHLIISKLAVGEHNNNVYLLRCRTTGEQILIDAAAEADRVLELIGADGISALVTTHGHKDHWQALADVAKATGAQTIAHEADADSIDFPIARRVVDGETISFGEITLTAIHLVGHTPGSIALAYDDPDGAPHLFTGDCLFPGGVGNTQQDPERFTSLLNDVSAKLFDRFPDETWVYAGHGGDASLGSERPHLAEWRERGW